MLKDLKTLTWSEQLTDNYLRSSVLLFLSIKVLLNGLQIFSVLWGNWKGSKRRNRWDNFVTWKTWKHYRIEQNEIKKKFCGLYSNYPHHLLPLVISLSRHQKYLFICSANLMLSFLPVLNSNKYTAWGKINFHRKTYLHHDKKIFFKTQDHLL